MRMALPRTIFSIDVVVEALHLLLGDLAGVRPGRVGVRVVALVGDVVDADGVEVLQPVRVVEEAAVDVLAEQLARRLRHLVGDAAPAAVLLPHHVGPLEDVRDPADLALGVGDLQVAGSG